MSNINIYMLIFFFILVLSSFSNSNFLVSEFCPLSVWSCLLSFYCVYRKIKAQMFVSLWTGRSRGRGNCSNAEQRRGISRAPRTRSLPSFCVYYATHSLTRCRIRRTILSNRFCCRKYRGNRYSVQALQPGMPCYRFNTKIVI